MNVFTVRQEVEQGQVVFFCYRNHTVVSTHKSADTAWSSAEAKAKLLATKTNSNALYTTCPSEFLDESGASRAAWVVA